MLDPTKTSLPAKWAIEFTMALRSRDVTGAAIGDALRAAEAHCADSGQSPEEAFGPAAAYADSLTDLPRVTGGASLTTRIGPNALGLLGLLLALPTLDAWRAGGPSGVVSISLGTGLSLLVILLIVLTLVLRPRIVRTRVWVGLLLSVGFLAPLLFAWLLVQPLAQLPALPSALVAAAALVGSGLWQMRVLDPDVIVDPLEAPGRPGWVFTLVTAWLFPLLTLVAIAVSLLAPRR